jgi:N utilization substance protein B
VLAGQLTSGRLPADDYAVVLAEGVAANTAQIDAAIGRHSRDWSLHRMPAVDRAALRIAVFEITTGAVPNAVAIDEAVRMVGELSTEESPGFVNGVLAAVVRDGSDAPAAEPGAGDLQPD